jgi:hypothetical protein
VTSLFTYSAPQGEVAKTVFERYRVDTYNEASHKP